MTVAQLIEALELRLLTPKADMSRKVTGGCTGDLLSFVMAKGESGMVWITVQTHLNVIAVASLHEFSCVIVAENCTVEADTLAKAEEEGIPVFVSSLSSYTLAGKLYELGVR
ncbi:MAG: AraC family transcriptional regulator [Clostridia bacterium]|nr:AraC family transcriptional regulator [Clostridia bacterium]